MPTVSSDTKDRVVGDLIKHEWNQIYTRDSRTLDNDSAGASTEVTDIIGYPVRLKSGTGSGTAGVGTDYALCKAGEEASCVGLVVGGTEKSIPAMLAWDETKDEFALLVRGPAVISQDGLPAADWDAGSFDKDAISAALAAISVPIITAPMPAVKSTQTT